MNRRKFVGQIAVTTVILQAGCVDTVPTNETEADSDADSDNQTMNETNNTESGEAEALYAPLPGLITAENRTAYAADNDLQYVDGMVSVEIILKGDKRPTEHIAEVDGQYDELVRGTVAVDELRPLADDPRVRAVRQPAQPQPTGQ